MSQEPTSVNSSYRVRVGELLTIAIAMALTLPFTNTLSNGWKPRVRTDRPFLAVA